MAKQQMIEKLTKKQEEQMPVYRDKWIKIGLNCEKTDWKRANKAVEKAYAAAELEAPPMEMRWLVDSPYAGAILASVLEQREELLKNTAKQPKLILPDDLHQVWEHNISRIDGLLKLPKGFWNNTNFDKIKEGMRDKETAMVYGSHDAGWLSYYDYFLQVCGLECCRKLEGLMELALYCGWWAPYKEAVILQERHCNLYRNPNNQLHKDLKMAVEYPDGWGVWALNGVRCPRWLVETPGENLDVQKVITIENVEQRKEGVRKIGVERIVHKLGATTLQKDGAYQLLEFDVGLPTKVRALRMENPSVPEVYHIEFVDVSCSTVQEALNFRNSLTPEMIDDEEGSPWYQQGDVIIRPKGATKFKSRPDILT